MHARLRRAAAVPGGRSRFRWTRLTQRLQYGAERLIGDDPTIPGDWAALTWLRSPRGAHVAVLMWRGPACPDGWTRASRLGSFWPVLTGKGPRQRASAPGRVR